MLDESWELSPSVAIRPEPFGALAYNFDNRRLTFLKRPELVALVKDLGAHRTVREALTHHGIPADLWNVYIETLRSLGSAELLIPSRKLAHA
jgi:putative mycofactocin binding protein MftB